MLTLPDNLPPSAQSTVVSPSARVNSLVDGPLVGTVAEYKLNPNKQARSKNPFGGVDLCKFVLKYLEMSPFTPSGEWTSRCLYMNIVLKAPTH